MNASQHLVSETPKDYYSVDMAGPERTVGSKNQKRALGSFVALATLLGLVTFAVHAATDSSNHNSGLMAVPLTQASSIGVVKPPMGSQAGGDRVMPPETWYNALRKTFRGPLRFSTRPSSKPMSATERNVPAMNAERLPTRSQPLSAGTLAQDSNPSSPNSELQGLWTGLMLLMSLTMVTVGSLAWSKWKKDSVEPNAVNVPRSVPMPLPNPVVHALAPAERFALLAPKPRQYPRFGMMAISNESDAPIVYTPPLATPILDHIQGPGDMNKLSNAELKQLVHELRAEVLKVVSQTGGHLGSALGVIELTVALHYVFQAPEDPIVWDVAHQAYPHKILTGRRSQMNTLRQQGGVSGFTKRDESIYDPFGAGHSTTSISAILGMSIARNLQKRQNHCVAVIGDGAITGGMAYEAMNCAAYFGSNIVVVLNDNGQVSLPTGIPSAGGTGPVGALSQSLRMGASEMMATSSFEDVRDVVKGFNMLLPSELQQLNKKIDEYARGLITGGVLFEELGFHYVGPVNGHDIDTLVPALKNTYDRPRNKPVLLHVKTQKGHGYIPAEKASDKYHAVPKFDVPTGKFHPSPPGNPTYTAIFGQSIVNLGAKDRNVVCITAAMPGGTGLDKFGRRFPERMFDVGIAEQHAVTFAAGLAVEGIKPFCALYSTFLQRGYDQVVHDVALQRLPVRFMVDRAGLVGHDGPTHHGSFDLSFLGCLPGIVIMAPSNELELVHMVATAYAIDDMPSVVRYPRGNACGLESLQKDFGYDVEEIPPIGTPLEIGKGYICKEGQSVSAPTAKKVTILSLGTRLRASLAAANELERVFPDELSVTCADARFMKPLDMDLIRSLAKNNDVLITIEENSIGGFGDHVIHQVMKEGLLDNGKLKMRAMVLPDDFIEAGTQEQQLEEAGLTTMDIVANIMKLTDKSLPGPDMDGEEIVIEDVKDVMPLA